MLEKIANQARIHIVKMINEAKAGHPGGSLSCVDILTYLYHREMNVNKENASSFDRNRLVLSKGHAAPALYALLHSIGLLEEKELWTLRKIDSNLQGHPNMNDVAGIDMSTGSLGQGISVAVGMALANKYKKNDYYVFSVLGDGECQEGQVYEAAMAAAHYKLNNLIVFLDYNGLQIDGKITDVMNPESFVNKFKAFNWNVLEIDGHNFQEIENSVNQAKQSKDQPTMIVAHTIKGKGVSFMENQVGWHGKAPSKEEYEIAVRELEAKL